MVDLPSFDGSAHGRSAEFGFTPRWRNLISEAQFATELTVSGLRRLCAVPVGGDPNSLVVPSYDRSYPLHVGLLSYVNGLERLCKLTIACHGYVVDGSFPNLRKYSHKIGGLLDAIEALDLGAVESVKKVPGARPRDVLLDPTLTELLERYATGAGRYEHLDSLWNDDAEVVTLYTWVSLCGRTTPSPDIQHLSAARDAAVQALQEVCTDGGLETVSDPYLEEMEPIFGASVGVALALYRKVGWVASVLDFVTYYTSKDLPIVGEALIDLRLPDHKFFMYSVARINDLECVEEELGGHFKRMAERPEEDDILESETFRETEDRNRWGGQDAGPDIF